MTACEVEMLHLVATGLRAAESAERLYLPPRTISTHLGTIYGMLGVENRAAATRFAIAHRLA
ncbi:MAG TPA: LuxR C-terminal-related transcriptional regulator [Thermomicrobiales bacterium]|nr:LuxR C-terminal-related transcriptional regulator [Thermomicrobiales bacterium]